MEKILNKRKIRNVVKYLEEVHSRKWHLEEEEEFRKCKGTGSRVWGEDECRSKITRKVG